MTKQELEFDAARIREVQARELRKHIEYCRTASPFYRERWADLDVPPVEEITPDDITRLPLTDKSEIAEHNDAFLAVPGERVVDIVLSSGTTGLPTRIAYTEHDLQRLAYNEAQSFTACGVTGQDTVLLTCTLDRCFIAGLAYFMGVRKLGAAAIRNGHGTMDSHADVIQRLQPTVAVGVPSFLRKLGEYLKNEGINPSQTRISKLVCIGEPVRDATFQSLKLGQDLEELWGATTHSTYASSETVTTFCECTEQAGGHLHPDLAIVEIVDEKGIPVAEGETGEVVVTPLGVEGMPLIRFRTGDISFLVREPCSCGRVSPRLGPIIGRRAQMLKVKGTTLYPQSVFAVLDELPLVKEYYLSAETLEDLSDRISIHVALADNTKGIEIVAEKVQTRLRVRPKVVPEPEEEIRKRIYTPESRKPIRFFDRRMTP